MNTFWLIAFFTLAMVVGLNSASMLIFAPSALGVIAVACTLHPEAEPRKEPMQKALEKSLTKAQTQSPLPSSARPLNPASPVGSTQRKP